MRLKKKKDFIERKKVHLKPKNLKDRPLSTSPYSELKIPSTIFLDRDVSILEAVVEYLKDKSGLTYHEIAILLERDDRTIWTSYNRVKKKRMKNV